MKHESVRLGVTTCDAIIANGELHAITKVTPLFVEIKYLRGDREPISLTHAELAELIDGGQFSIQYGYFESRQVARRAVAGRTIMTRISTKAQLDAFWKECWSTTFLEMEVEGLANRSAERWHEFLPDLERRVSEKLRLGLKKATAGAAFDSITIRRTPCRTSIMGWVRDWEACKDPMVFVKKSTFNGSNAKRVGAEQEAVIQWALESYLHPNQIAPAHVHETVNIEIRKRNKVRELSGEIPLSEVSQSTIERRIKELDQFEVLAARKGLAAAKNKLGAHGGGLKLAVPLSRIEMDEWEIDLIALLKKGGFDISKDSVRDIETGRYWVCVAFDTATRSIVGLKLSRSPTAEDAKAVLWMAMRDKTDLARQLGCETAWKQHGHIGHVAVDNGPAFVNAEFKAALSDLCIDYSVLPAGIPKLRGHVERVFLTFVKRLMPYLTGRTHSNPKERGDYPSQKYAVHTAESIIELLVRFTVDVYHNRKHSGLEYATPNIVWDRLIKEFGWSPSMSNHTLRHILGVAFSRDTGRHGVLVNGVNYHSERLAKHFQKFGKQHADVRIDPEDMGHISVWLENGADSGWSTLKSQIDGLDGVSFAAWEQTIFNLRQNNRNAASLTQGVVDRAIERIKEIDAEQCAQRQLGPIGETYEQIKRAQKETFWGLSLGSDPQLDPKPLDGRDRSNQGLLSNEIEHDPNPQPEDQPVLREKRDEPIPYWPSSDDEQFNDDNSANQENDDDNNE
ncbi:DDE-type integrase/transposase/recombinase [Sulfitobacter sp. M57]|uniref:Mu transposase C-terminal domain-containing protein n=1 Tax=unclassified Sulfitobacter TaxID=196795 RepID=UPI0023E27BA2|nr:MULTISPECIES: DDE-type integrase/transposase/recombinase [unclassified Sulfitobacter]MDF3414427.1 DDE-type integrase/transposase/recombinase [Sulfitobacter sp. KE5]MDF3421908.1 DDE-type integrase/transposase/recombinase [Sulfitobacter sp. KE43]MDF3432973.1 DDE-type integrase/transposase/recombinase [Sulfitobacter sp. KE42]MDF3458613.1 DDE-type integrase/transposase/recombinase [Sulfitobacter sp. S74]MDF3462513.1 DDE-type integrase/transposase/recombinase [Sulfitobacter sp. Ks18]